MTVEIDLLSRAGVAAADGRPIFAYSCTDPERARLGADLRLRLELNPQHPVTARRFVLWAVEEIRTQLPPGGLTWAWLFGRLGRAPDGVLGRAFSTSYAPRDPARAAELADALRTAVRRYARDGRVVLCYRTSVYLGRRPPLVGGGGGC